MKSLLITDLDETLLHDNGEKNGYLPSGELDLDYFRTDRELPTLKEAVPNIIGLNVLKYFSGNNVEINFCTRGNTDGVFSELQNFLSKHYKYKHLKNKTNYSHSLEISDLANNDLYSDTAGEESSWIQSRYDKYDQIFFMDDQKLTIDYIRGNFSEITTIWIKPKGFNKIIQASIALAFDAGQKLANQYTEDERHDKDFIHKIVKLNNRYIHEEILKDEFDYSEFIDCSDKSLQRDLTSYFKQNVIFQASLFRAFCGGLVNNFEVLKESLITESKKKLVLMKHQSQDREGNWVFSDGFTFYAYAVATGEIRKFVGSHNQGYSDNTDGSCPGYRGAALRVWECNWDTKLTTLKIKEPTGEKYEIDYSRKRVYHDDIFLYFKDIEEQRGYDNWLYYLVNHEDDLTLIEFSKNKIYQ